MTAILLQFAGAVMLLLYATQQVRIGFERAAGPQLRSLVGGSGRNALTSAGAGVVVALLLQSATAVALLVAAFATSGVLLPHMALAIVLGADLGTTLVVQFLSFNLAALIPILLTVGAILFLRVERQWIRQSGRVLLGIAFVLMSLRMLGDATTPLKESPVLPPIIEYLGRDEVAAFLGATVLTFLFHSSVAGVLFIATLASRGMLPLDAALPMVLGANVGGGLVAVWLTRTSALAARRIVLANLGFRGVGAGILLAVLALFPTLPIPLPGATEARQLVNFHVIFNLVLVAAALPLISPAMRLATLALPGPRPTDEPLRPPSALDRGQLENPSVALAGVTREVLRMAEIIEVMAAPLMELFHKPDPDRIAYVRSLEKEINKAQMDIKLYIAEFNRGVLSARDSARGMELSKIAIDLERVGDIIAKELLGLVESRQRKGIQFSEQGWKELTTMHRRVMSNMKLAMNVLVSEDLDGAKQLLEEKVRIRQIHQASQDAHLSRLRENVTGSIGSSNMHLAIARAFREINSIFVSFAYPTLERSGVLLDSRLADHASS